MVSVTKASIYDHLNSFTEKIHLDCEPISPRKGHSGLKVGQVAMQGGRRVKVVKKTSWRTSTM